MRWLPLALLLAVTMAAAAPWQAGDALPTVNLKDQHDKPLAIGKDTRLIFFAAEMAGSKMMTSILEALPPTTLQDRKAVYVADISTMPGPISIMVAVPKMKSRPYAVGVVRFERDAIDFPRKRGAVTVMKLDNGKISAVEFAQEPQQIAAHLK